MFSQVEQQINTNDNLQSLIALNLSQTANSAVNYIGRSVVMTNGEGSLETSSTDTNTKSCDWTYNLALNICPAGTTLTVKDANGKVVLHDPGRYVRRQQRFQLGWRRSQRKCATRRQVHIIGCGNRPPTVRRSQPPRSRARRSSPRSTWRARRRCSYWARWKSPALLTSSLVGAPNWSPTGGRESATTKTGERTKSSRPLKEMEQ